MPDQIDIRCSCSQPHLLEVIGTKTSIIAECPGCKRLALISRAWYECTVSREEAVKGIETVDWYLPERLVAEYRWEED